MTVKTLTPTPTNGTANATVQSSRPGTQVVVEEGPVWLARLGFNPPPWVYDAIWLLVVAVGVLTALGYVRNGGLDEAVIREMSLAALTVVGAIVAAHLVAPVAWLPWGAKAVVAGGSGWVGARLVERGADRLGDSDMTPDGASAVRARGGDSEVSTDE